MRLRIRERLLFYALKIIHHFDKRAPDFSELGSQKIQRILLISSTALGDAMMSTPAFHAIRKTYPWAIISLLLHKRYIDMFSGHPDIDEILLYEGGYRKFFRLALSFRKREIDLVCILHGNEPQATPLAYLSGARFIFKLPNTNRFNFLLSNPTPVLDWKDFKHGIEQRLKVAALAAAKSEEMRMILPVLDEDKIAIARELEKAGIASLTRIVGFQVGASTTSRRWPQANFVELANQLLVGHTELAIIITGSPNELTLCTQTATLIKEKNPTRQIWVSASQISLKLLPALLQRCTVLVTGDTGPMHLAITVGTPIVGLFAVSDATRSGPAYDFDRHQIIQKNRTCVPCRSKRCTYPEPICMKNISVEEVRLCVKKILEKTNT